METEIGERSPEMETASHEASLEREVVVNEVARLTPVNASEVFRRSILGSSWIRYKHAMRSPEMETVSHEASPKREVVMNEVARFTPSILTTFQQYGVGREFFRSLLMEPKNDLSDNCLWAARMPQCSYVRDIIKHNHFTQESAALESAAQAGKSEIIFDGLKGWRKLNGGIMMRPRLKGLAVNIRPPKWTDNTFWIRADNYNDAKFIADVACYYFGRRSFHYKDVTIQHPPLRLATRELLTREACAAYVKSIANGPAHQKERENYRDQVKELVRKAVKSPEAVLSLSSQRPAASSDGAAVESEIAYDANVGGCAEEDSEEDNEVDSLVGFCLENMIPTNYRPRYNHSPPFVMDESLEETTAESSPYFEKDLTTKKKNTATVSDDDDVLTKIAPLFMQQIEDVLSSTLLPLISVLRSREEEEQKHREQMLALEKQKLALKRDKLLFELRRGAKRPRSSHKSARHQGHKKPRY